MTMTFKMLAAGAGLAAMAVAAPAAAQYYPNPYGYGPTYGHSQPYGYAWGNPYGYGASLSQMATQQCAAAVQHRLNRQRMSGVSGVLGAVLGVNTASQARVLSFTRIEPRSSSVRVRGLASSGRMAGYGPYGVGAYGAYGYGAQPDLSFKCDVDFNGRIRDIDINRRF